LLLFLAHSANVINIILTFVVVVKYFGEAVTPRFYRIRVFSEKPNPVGFIRLYWVLLGNGFYWFLRGFSKRMAIAKS